MFLEAAFLEPDSRGTSPAMTEEVGMRRTIGPKAIRTERDYQSAMSEVARLWGSKRGTPSGDRLDALATLIDAYEAEHYPMGRPDRTTPKKGP